MSAIPDDLDIVVVGASGDLARNKIFPALFALYCQELLPAQFRVYGFARTEFSHEQFRARINERLTCRYAPGESCQDRMREFLARCFYVQGVYGNADSYLDLFGLMKERGRRETNRLFYLAIPPSVFLDVAKALGSAGLVTCNVDEPWTRVVIEKPFGRDRDSSARLTRGLADVFEEAQTYRIDHYLGKEVIQNLMVLRFANLVFDPIWNHSYVERVCIDWKEDIGVEGRGGYYDDYGIVRDVVQNHLLQILALIAMERPVSTSAQHVRDQKVRLLKRIAPLAIEDLVLGQYAAGDGARRGYREEEGIPADSRTPTYAACVLRVRNARWRGVPFVITAGKALGTRMTEVRLQFRSAPVNLFCEGSACLPANELVIRVQPDEAIRLNIVNKEPGLRLALAESSLDLRYQSAFSGEIPDAYESLLLDVLQGDRSLFIREDELDAAWRVFTPVLHEVEKKRVTPVPYAFGSDGPDEARALSSDVT